MKPALVALVSFGLLLGLPAADVCHATYDVAEPSEDCSSDADASLLQLVHTTLDVSKKGKAANITAPSLHVLQAGWANAMRIEAETLVQLQRSSSAVGVPVIVIAILLLVFCIVPMAYCGIGACIGSLAASAIETFDTDILGVDITTGSVNFWPLHGCLEVRQLVVANPPGYDTDFLMKVSEAAFDIDTIALVGSGFHRIKIDKLVLKDVTIIYEAKWSGSNVHEVLQTLEGKSADQSVDADRSASSLATSANSKLQKAGRSCHRLTQPSEYQVELHKVIFEKVHAKMVGDVFGRHPSVDLEVADLHWQDFAAQVGSAQAVVIMSELLKSILKTVVANTAGLGHGKSSSKTGSDSAAGARANCVSS